MTCGACRNWCAIFDEMSNLRYCRIKERLVPDFEVCDDLDEEVNRSMNEWGVGSIKFDGDSTREVRSDGRIRKLFGQGDIP